MNEREVSDLLDRVKLHYQHLSLSDELLEEWFRVLKKYKNEEVINNLDKYLMIEKNRDRIPNPFDLIDGLITQQQKEKLKNDYLIDCNLCHKTMTLSEYDSHYSKCLKIRSVMTILKRKGQAVEYDELFRYDIDTLEKFLNKNKVYEKRNFNGNKNVFRGEEQTN